MKLYELKKGDKFKVLEEEGEDFVSNENFLFDHVDGLYSVCYVEHNSQTDYPASEGEPYKEVIHIVAYANVKKLEVVK